MVTEVVVKETISSEMIDLGADIVRRLDEAKFAVSAAFWFYLPETNVWRFFIASPGIRLDGVKQAYKKVQSMLSTMPENNPRIELKDISIIDSNDALVSLLKMSIRAEGINGIRFSKNIINGVLIEDAYIYRMT